MTGQNITENITEPLSPDEAEHWEATCRKFIDSDDRVKQLYGQLMRDFGITAQNVTAGLGATGEEISSFAQALAWVTADLAGCFALHNVDADDHEKFATEFADVVRKMILNGVNLPLENVTDTQTPQGRLRVVRVAIMPNDEGVFAVSPDLPELKVTGKDRAELTEKAGPAIGKALEARGAPGEVEQARLDDMDVLAFVVTENSG